MNRLLRGDINEGKQKRILGLPTSGSRESQSSHGPSNSIQKVTIDSPLHPPKQSFPKFDGENLKAWIRKCEGFFIVHLVTAEPKVLIVSIHFKKKAESWFQLIYCLKKGIMLEEFTQALLTRFLDIDQEDVVGQLGNSIGCTKPP
ncbi:hypothetical protein Ddye_009423 [Dipteronia dyeriana]|uniref:Retrotransposon gag domain-containing protein n=1 Tax=Dipteronia dyeriana TaxID=168575 RepID=A0AAD9XBC7_9ROSI|nr:hypothetical protein Ddye_009423 [Dipteronia dyeriana]